MRVDPGSVRFCSLVDDEHGFTASFNRSFLPLLATDLGGEQRIWRGGYAFQQCTSAGVVEGRNEAVKAFLESPAEWLFFVDSDMGYEPDALEQLMAVADPEERPIVGGLCFGFGPISDRIDHAQGVIKRPFPTVFDLDETSKLFQPRWYYRPNSLERCSATGGALLLIHRSVFERLSERWPDQGWFDRIRHPEAKKTWGEDTSFCARAGMCGIPVYVHTGVKTSHAKTIFVTETTYFDMLRAQPATDEVAVIVPVLNRPQNAEPFMRSLRASTGLAKVYAVCSNTGDADAWEKVGATIVRTDQISFANKVNKGFRESTEPWIFIVGDDVQFYAGWLDHAQQMAKITGAKVVGTNDLANSRVMAGEHATHMLIARDYVDLEGASWDGPGVVCHKGYSHWYVDDEIVTVARDRGVFAPALASIVEHLHPMVDKAELDSTYQLGAKSRGKDKALFVKRSQQHTAAA